MGFQFRHSLANKEIVWVFVYCKVHNEQKAILFIWSFWGKFLHIFTEAVA